MSAITLRLYCHGIGDCLLIKLVKSDGSPFWMLIDCGLHSSTKNSRALIREVVEDILATTDRLDVVVGTHEHWDHNSGFQQAEDLFAQIDVGEVWFAWTEKPGDPQATELDKYKESALSALARAALALAGSGAQSGAGERLDSLFGFAFGAAGEKSRDARERLRALSSTVVHHEPGTIAQLPAGLDDFRIYILGPSRDPKLFGMVDSVTETYTMGPESTNRVQGLANALAINNGELSQLDDPLAPFDSTVGHALSKLLETKPDLTNNDIAFLDAHYLGAAASIDTLPDKFRETPDQSWRRIDHDWLGSSSELAMQLDSKTNNTSLVLAIEHLPSKQVLLFAADAQVGNWRGWAELEFDLGNANGKVAVKDLLARAVFYKVGHHGSRNATRGPGGLEAMTSPNLSAFVPTDDKMAEKVKWTDFPAQGLLTRLTQKTSGRLVISDRIWTQPGAPTPPSDQQAWFDKITVKAGKVDPARTLYVEWTIG